MSSNTIHLPSDRRREAAASQATAIEQARAVAEVQAAVVVAQQMPRNVERALGEMRDSCGRLSLAKVAFYSVPNRGQGMSVHLLRELARIWGNIQYGVHELRRDDDAGMSEVLAFAWDVQTNTRSTRTFQVPHARMVKKDRVKLTDLGDVYLNNQNVGARAVRECIATVLPRYFLDEAESLARRTLEHGEGESMEDRTKKMLGAFQGIGVVQEQLEKRLGKARGQWTAVEVANAGVIFTSIQRGDSVKDEEFPPLRVSANEVAAQAQTRAQQPDSDPVGDEADALWVEGQ